jgi:hypothetical protein
MTDVIPRRQTIIHPAQVRFLRALPLLLSSLLLAAHFYRSGHIVFVIVALALPLLLLAPFRWAVPAVQVALFVAAAEWVRTAVAIADVRQALGASSARMLVILLSVALFTAFSAFPLRRT